ncbi:hypothetical protein NMG60_11030168 [Bertholletia excelsa]
MISQTKILSTDGMNGPCPPHDLVLEIEKPEKPESKFCKYCNEEIRGSYYRCLRCSDSDLHKSCLQPLNQIQHPFHSQHPLFLKNSNTKTSCNACRKDDKTPTYNCSLCSFCLHYKCSKLTPLIKTSQGGGGERLLPDHPHPLLLCNKDDEYKDFDCDYCKFRLDDLIYVCLECKTSLHKNCARCPLIINHPLHAPHRLRLSLGDGFKCSFCGENYSGFYYSCEECGYTLDASCSYLMPIRGDTGGHEGGNLTLLQPNDTYPLLVLQKNDSIKSCGACEQLIKDANDPIYFCSKCKMFLHKSCTELSREIQTPIDPLHLLKLEDECIKGPFSKGRELKKCTLCDRRRESFVYRCSDNCEIMLHLKCFSILQASTTLMSINHHHPLFQLGESLSEHSYGHIICSKCQEPCGFPFFSCFSCKLDLHAHCLPKLPTTIKSPYHRHSLTLTYFPIKDWPDEPDDADFYCDNCEERRKLHEPTYYCKRCDFVAHLGCVLPQIKEGLEEEWSAASKSGHVKYETYDDMSKKLLRDINKELEYLRLFKGCVEKHVDRVRERRKQLEEARDGKDLWTVSRLARGRLSSFSERVLNWAGDLGRWDVILRCH